jgi:ADP-heptose:LPS heptosyltransferase
LPNCRFDYLTTTLAAEVLAGNPALEHVLPWNSSSNPSSLKPEHVVALRNSRYDAILCTNVVRHQEAVGLAFTLRIPNRVAFIHRGLSGLVTLPVTLAAPTNPPAQSRAMAAAVTGLKDDSELRPRIFLSQADRMEAEAEWERLGLRNTDLIATCSVTTRQIIGKVPSSFFADALQSLHAIAPGARIILTGSHDDADTLSSMAAKLGGHVAVSAGRLSVRGFAAFLERSSVHFCMDSGPRHLANAVGTPVVFVRNLSVRAAEAGAYCPSEMDVMPYADYLTPDQASRTLSEVEPSAVATAILRQAGERASTIPR